jgi:L-threonylcarbamoyladenylate synthase
VSEVFEVDPARPEEARRPIEAAAAALAAGELVVFPTETVYGVAARPDIAKATGRLFEAKRRPAHLTLPVLAADADTAWRYGVRGEAAAALAAAYWPGPITLVVRRTPASRWWNLGEARVTIGLRVPDHRIAQALLRRTGPLATTSANRSGSPPAADRDELLAAFEERVAVYLFLRAGVANAEAASSTVVDLTGERAKVLREGPISVDDLRRRLPEAPP